MKLLSLLSLFFVATTNAITPITSPALQVRGGASLGPIDADLVSTVGSASLSAYVGASASKWVAGATGGSAPGITSFMTNEIVSLLALAQAISTAAYFIGDSGIASADMGVYILAAALVQKSLDAGGIDKIVDTVKENRVLALITILSAYVNYF